MKGKNYCTTLLTIISVASSEKSKEKENNDFGLRHIYFEILATTLPWFLRPCKVDGSRMVIFCDCPLLLGYETRTYYEMVRKSKLRP